MSNKGLAGVLSQIAALLALEGGDNRFRVAAYEKASRTIDSLPEPVETLVREGRLKDIKGVGAHIATRIAEFVETGHVSYLDELRAQFPPGLLEIMSLQGVGPKKAKTIHETLHISSIDELAKAAEAGTLRDLPGFGVKTEQNILHAISFRAASSGRILIDEATALADNIVSLLRARCPGIRQIQPAGSLRRMRETIGDIDILCTVTRGAETAVVEQFVTLPLVRAVLAKGTTKVTIQTDTGVQIDLRIIDPASFGAALQYFTGSKEHNVALRGLARDHGLTINEYGVYRLDDKTVPLAGDTEESVYRSVGLPFIPPQLREDRGEIAAARAGRLPDLVSIEHIRGDTHTHSRYSDGEDTIATLAAEAGRRGYEWLIITDHSQGLSIANGLSPERVRNKMKEIAAYNSTRTDVAVLCGTEVDILADGSLDYPDELLAALDFVVASVHNGFKQTSEQLTRRIITALRHPLVHCIGHPTGRLLKEREPYAIDMDAVIAAAAETGTLLEINASPQRLDLTDVMCRQARDAGVQLCIGSDAHASAQLGHMACGVAVAQRGWLEPGHVLNTLPHDMLRARLTRIRKDKHGRI